MADFDPFNTNGVGNSLNLINQDSLGSGVVTQTRANNAVSYFLPEKLGGFYGNVMLTRSGGLPGQKYTGARFGYANGPLKLQAALGQTETATSSTPKFKQSNVAVSYNIGVARLVSFVNVNEYDVKKATVYMLGAFVPVGADEIHVAFLNRKSSGGGTDANGANQFTLGYLHNFTKDTTVYANMGRLSNSGGSNFTQTGGPAAGSRTGFGSTGIEIGYRRFF
jgi:predicted porin